MTGSMVEVNADIARALSTGLGKEILTTGAAAVTAEIMIENISKESGSGRAYKTNSGIGYHIASAPGQFPVKETGALVGSINISNPRDPNDGVDIEISSSYALDLELGTSRMRSRPFIKKSISEAFSTRLPDIIGEFVRSMENNPSTLKHLLDSYRADFDRRRRARVRRRSTP